MRAGCSTQAFPIYAPGLLGHRFSSVCLVDCLNKQQALSAQATVHPSTSCLLQTITLFCLVRPFPSNTAIPSHSFYGFGTRF